MTKKQVPKSVNKFSRERCDFRCSKESKYKDIHWHGNIKYELIRTKKCQKMPENIITIMVKCFLVFYFIVFLMSTWIPFWIFYNLSMKNFCKNIKFCFRPSREIISNKESKFRRIEVTNVILIISFIFFISDFFTK